MNTDPLEVPDATDADDAAEVLDVVAATAKAVNRRALRIDRLQALRPSSRRLADATAYGGVPHRGRPT
ncbi:hypothetical protein ABZ260_39860 [Streptosporangium sp. NPDC006013]|uniref:hypothetical protein n=1 Tax=Streptosporangium sp. NPDC006013 TaxID=3155596 RepID=UPI0033BCF199